MILNKIFLNNIDFYNLISCEVENTHHRNLNINELRQVAKQYINYCESVGPVSLHDFIKNDLIF